MSYGSRSGLERHNFGDSGLGLHNFGGSGLELHNLRRKSFCEEKDVLAIDARCG